MSTREHSNSIKNSENVYNPSESRSTYLVIKTRDKPKEKPIFHRNKQPHRYIIMVKYIVAGFSIEETAQKMNVPVKQIQTWLKKPTVLEYLTREAETKINFDAKKRKSISEYILKEIYNSIVDKFANGSLQKMNTKNLFKYLIDFMNQVRTDNPADVNKKISHTITISEELSNRFKQANSATFDVRVDETIIDVEPPKLQITGGNTNVSNVKETEKEGSRDNGSDDGETTSIPEHNGGGKTGSSNGRKGKHKHSKDGNDKRRGNLRK